MEFKDVLCFYYHSLFLKLLNFWFLLVHLYFKMSLYSLSQKYSYSMIYFKSSTKLLENLQTREVGALVSKLSLQHSYGLHIWALSLFMRLLQKEKKQSHLRILMCHYGWIRPEGDEGQGAMVASLSNILPKWCLSEHFKVMSTWHFLYVKWRKLKGRVIKIRWWCTLRRQTKTKTQTLSFLKESTRKWLHPLSNSCTLKVHNIHKDGCSCIRDPPRPCPISSSRYLSISFILSLNKLE